jgi:diadenosine tetraphosphate (Ap4A) HIT family hydrolase
VSFALDPRLAADAFVIGDLSLSRALLMNDARFPWVILVPRRADRVEIGDLAASERAELMEEIARVAAALAAWPEVEKINFGALGNIVPQLHAHVIGRRRGDAAWPGPVWGAGAAIRYEPAAQQARLSRLAEALALAPPSP